MYAYAFIKHDGSIERVHALGTWLGGNGAGTPTTTTNQLERLIEAGYAADREVVIPGGADASGAQLGSKVLLVLKKA